MMKPPTARRVPAAVLAAFALTMAACGDDDSAGPEEGATVEDVLEDPGGELDDDALGTEGNDPELADDAVFDDADAYIGEQVTVSGEVTAQINDSTFQIAGPELPLDDDDDGDDDEDAEENDGLLVFSAEGAPELGTADVVRVTGIVREVRREGFEDMFGLPWEVDYVDFLEKHAIAATNVEVIGEDVEELENDS